MNNGCSVIRLLLLCGSLLLPTLSGAGEFKYVFPVQPVEKASFSQGGHAYLAIDIFAPEGTSFAAPISGVIEDINGTDRYNPKNADPAAKGGIWVSLIGDDGYRYYGSHLKSVAADIQIGRRVQAGAVLGTVGRSGNAAKTPPHLHFGISLATRPYEWNVRRGEIEPFPFLKCILQEGCDPIRKIKQQ